MYKLHLPHNPNNISRWTFFREQDFVIRLSIVIPLLGDSRRLDDTLVSVLENRPQSCEIIVVHNEPYEDPYQLDGEVRFIEAPHRATAAECLNLGLAASRAPVVHVLSCGVEVAHGWSEAAMRRLGDAEVAAVAALILSAQDPARVVSAGLGYRSEGVAWLLGQGMPPAALGECRGELCGPDIAAAFYCRSALDEIGGFRSLATGTLTGIDAALELRRLGFRAVFEPGCVARADGSAATDAIGFRHGRDAERLFWRWASAAGRARSLLGHAALLIGECAIALWRPAMLAQLAGRACGAMHAAVASRRSPPNKPLSFESSPCDRRGQNRRQIDRAA